VFSLLVAPPDNASLYAIKQVFRCTGLFDGFFDLAGHYFRCRIDWRGEQGCHLPQK
jgi:hypothetical protein